MQPLMSSHFLSHFDELVTEFGGNPLQLIQACGLPDSLLSGVETLLPTATHMRLLDTAARELGEPLFAIKMARRQSVYFLGPLTAMLTAEKQVGDAMNVYSNHLDIRVQGVKTALRIEGGTAYCDISSSIPATASSRSFHYQAITLKCNILRWLCGNEWRPRAIYFPKPAEADELHYSRLLGGPVGFNTGRLCLSFDADFVSRPLAITTESSLQEFQQAMRRMSYHSTSQQVRFLIQSLLSSSKCDTDYIAFTLGLSRRSLQRRLSEEGTSFQRLIDSVRMEQAKSYLANDYYKLADVSGLLGFQDAAVFSRSFKRWFKQAPREWRAQALAAQCNDQMPERAVG